MVEKGRSGSEGKGQMTSVRSGGVVGWGGVDSLSTVSPSSFKNLKKIPQSLHLSVRRSISFRGVLHQGYLHRFCWREGYCLSNRK